MLKTDKVTEDRCITLYSHGMTYMVSGIRWDCSASELIDIFTRMLVCAGFDPGVIQCADGARYSCEVVDDLEEHSTECQVTND